MSQLDGQREIPATVGCRGACGVTVLLLALPLIVYSFFVWRERSANRDFERLLKGDSAIAIRAVNIIRHGETRARIESPAPLEYLAGRLQHAEADKGGLGDFYHVDFLLSTGNRVHCGLYIPRRCDQITLAFPFDSCDLLADDPVYYEVTLIPPIPKEVDEVLFKLGTTEGRSRANLP